jgi:cyclophilin family peptidyl-prolyl cis-trans isomerase
MPQYITTVSDFLLYLETLMVPYGRHLRSVQYSYCPPLTVDPEGTYTATLVTDRGEVTIALYPDVAPYAVNNFIFLAQEDYYDNTPFYAVIEGFIAQAGDPSGTGWGTPGYMFSTEISDQVSFDQPGMVAMGNASPTLVNSQFFITYSPLTFLDGQYTIFGEVVSGLDVLRSLNPRDPEVDPLLPLENYILDVIITE